MTPERWRVVRDIFDGAIQQDGASRSAYLDRVCRDDLALRNEVAAMLASDAVAGTFMERPGASLQALQASPETERAMPAVGSMVAHYRIVSELGAGGMGRVFRAEDTRLGRTVALKVLAPEWSESHEAHARFAREARLASALDHPNICTIYEVGQGSGVSFIAMQYLEGETLQQMLRRGPLPLDRLLSLGAQIADALAAAHARGIIHRDVKSSNVIVTTDGRGHVLDFGIAKLVDRREHVASRLDATQSGVIVGTPSNLSPEQARGAQVDHRTDVFQFGALLYEMATSQRPFRGATTADVIAAILTQPHVPAVEANPALPRSLGRVIDRALAKDPHDRFQTIDEIRTALQRCGDRTSAAALARSDASPHRRRPLPQRSGGLTIAAGVVAVAGLLATYKITSSHAPIDSIAVMPFAYQQNAGDLEYLADGVADGVIARLAELPSTRVIARSSTFAYKGRPIDAPRIGRELRVRTVLTGQVARDGQTVVVLTELADVDTGARLWGNEYRRPISALPTVASDLAVAVSRELKTRLSGEQERRLTRDYTRSPEAYQQYLKGRFFANKRTADGYGKAIENFTAAVTTDPTFALAYSGLADSYSIMRGYGIRSAEETIPLARAAAERAVRIDGTLAEAHTSLGKIATDTSRWSEADAAFARAIDLNPNYATAHHWQAMYLIEVGRVQEALAAIRRAQALDPLSLIINTELGRLLYFARDYDGAIIQLGKTLELDPDFPLAHLHLGSVLLETRRYDDAMVEFKKAARMGGPIPAVHLARAYALAGDRGQAEATLQELLAQSKQRFVPPSAFVTLYLSLGDQEHAIDWIERALGRVSSGPWFFSVNPHFDALRSNPRYQALVRRHLGDH